jgi:hypothetical protein
MQKKIGKKKVAKKLDVKGLRRSDRTRILRCKNMKGPGSDPSQPITIDEEDIGEDQHVETSSQPSLNDGKVGGCLGSLRGLRGWDISWRLTQ